MLKAAQTCRGLTEEALAAVLAEIKRSGSQRDYVLVKGSYLLGCRVREIAQLRWGDIEVLSGGGAQVHLVGKGSKARTIRVSGGTLSLFESLGRKEEDHYLFPSNRRAGHLSRQAIGTICRKWGARLGLHLHPHRLRHSHAIHSIRRGCDVFTLQRTLGHASSGTTGHYVASNPDDSSSLRLG